MADASALRQQALDRYGAVHDRASQLLEQALIDAAPLGATGDTRRGIEVRPGGGIGGSFASTAISKSPHGDFVEDGTAPHLILPRTARVLRFAGGSGRISQPGPNQRIATRSGGVVFSAYVNHPGTPARPWFAPTLERWSEFLQQAMATA